jgi:hypothetical protein
MQLDENGLERLARIGRIIKLFHENSRSNNLNMKLIKKKGKLIPSCFILNFLCQHQILVQINLLYIMRMQSII